LKSSWHFWNSNPFWDIMKSLICVVSNIYYRTQCLSNCPWSRLLKAIKPWHELFHRRRLRSHTGFLQLKFLCTVATQQQNHWNYLNTDSPVILYKANQTVELGFSRTVKSQFLFKYSPVSTIWCSIAVRSTSQTDEDLLLCCMAKESDKHAAEIVCRTTTVQGMQYGCLKQVLNNRFFAVLTTIC